MRRHELMPDLDEMESAGFPQSSCINRDVALSPSSPLPPSPGILGPHGPHGPHKKINVSGEGDRECGGVWCWAFDSKCSTNQEHWRTSTEPQWPGRGLTSFSDTRNHQASDKHHSVVFSSNRVDGISVCSWHDAADPSQVAVLSP